ncbi:SdrD B-like domain-containing protein [Methylobacillus glycogenes]|uniref:SdrD B-like domain-containing protein n=1 Tax=Methylobacillus glycogenes TaxID=406 RepID=UPI000471F2BC|nr:SdrD B-like domain-containing protein [Methylobacillus glycogenes]
MNNSGTDYNFGELAAAIGSASISGHVWLDGDHDRIYNSSSPAAEDRPQADWLVELWRNGSLVTSMTTAANGAYSFTNLPPGSGYQVKFIHPTTGTLYGHARPNEQGLGYDNGQVHPISNYGRIQP